MLETRSGARWDAEARRYLLVSVQMRGVGQHVG